MVSLRPRRGGSRRQRWSGKPEPTEKSKRMRAENKPSHIASMRPPETFKKPGLKKCQTGRGNE